MMSLASRCICYQDTVSSPGKLVSWDSNSGHLLKQQETGFLEFHHRLSLLKLQETGFILGYKTMSFFWNFSEFPHSL